MTAARRAWLPGAALAALLTLGPSSAWAGSKECIAAADEGQKLRDDGKLTEAREKFITCAAKACPGVIAKQCSQWLIDADQNTPTVTFRALDEQGKETFAVKVVIDGATVATAIEARALPVNPGEHTVRFELADGRAQEDKVLLRPGEKNRMIELSFVPRTVSVAPPPPAPIAPAPPAAPAEGNGFHVPLLGWVGLGVGVVGGALTAVLAISANNAESDLRSTCAPSCDASKKSSIDTRVALANVTLGVGIVGLGVGVVATILANTGAKPAPQGAKPDPSHVAFDVGPGSFLVHGAF